ncbi:MAG: Di-/tripeptide transporter [Calditrichaeota bacterium]|nr:Di-/tripeptide transporter [Calditrichota bacterium]
MAEQTTGKKQKMTPFPRTFYVANVMEIFERMAWYGFFALSSLYMTSPVSQGGLGFSSIERGILQGIIPFLLYLFPVITGALADRYGYRNTFLVAFAILTPAYFLLGQFTTFWSFFAAFLLVAVGAATFKPVVVGTVGKTTDDTNRGMGFGIFYTIVNVGGFVGPIFAGALRVLDWNYVFILLAITIAINFIPTIFFYKEPTTEAASKTKRSLKKVLTDAQEVLGNGRFAMIVIPIIFLLMLSGGEWLGWWYSIIGAGVWVVLVLLIPGWVSLVFMLPYALLLLGLDQAFTKPAEVMEGQIPEQAVSGTLSPADLQALVIIGAIWVVVFGFFWMRSARSGPSAWSREKPKIGNWAFVLYLLILSGFWASFNQIFITLPEYIRDFVQTEDLVKFAGIFGTGFVNFIASVNVEHLGEEINRLVFTYGGVGGEHVSDVFFKIVHYKVRVPHEEIIAAFNQLAPIGSAYFDSLRAAAGDLVSRFGETGADLEQVKLALTELMYRYHAGAATVEDIAARLSELDVSVTANQISPVISQLASEGAPFMNQSTQVAEQWAQNYRQVNPEYIVNIDAGSIVVFQILVSYVIQRWKPFPVLVVGTIVAGTGIALNSFAVAGALVVLAVIVFAFGEMIASPKSQEYVARIAPGDKTALFMGYYFVSIALGNLFGGILSGWGYEVVAREQNNPELMWLIFGGVGLLTAIALLFFNKLVVPHLESQHAANRAAQNQSS